MQRSNTLSSLFILFFAFILFACGNESKVFVGEWQDARTPENVWKITKSGSTFTGKRLSGDDFYKYDTEQWTFEMGQAGHPTLVPVKEGGSTLMYQAQQNRFLRNPPGRAYVKVIKGK